jgi:hypothetical protein
MGERRNRRLAQGMAVGGRVRFQRGWRRRNAAAQKRTEVKRPEVSRDKNGNAALRAMTLRL